MEFLLALGVREDSPLATVTYQEWMELGTSLSDCVCVVGLCGPEAAVTV